jgi:5'-nucleotidase
MDRPVEVLLTNDDGIDSPGIRALHDALSDVGNVTVVAPATDQSATGRALSREVEVDEHELGYAVHGTPSDCVVAGLEALGPYPDLVVSGCNKGANLGMYVLGRSGTVSAAVEAAFFGVPAIASSLYLPPGKFGEDWGAAAYAEAARATAYLAEHALDAGVFESADYLNVNAPRPGDGERGDARASSDSQSDGGPADVVVTRPSHAYEMDATIDEGRVTLHDRIWDRMARGDVDAPEDTDRHAVLSGNVSVSPLTAPHTTEHHEALDYLAERYRADE